MRPLFTGADSIDVVVPEAEGRADLVALLLLEAAEMEVELGAPIRIVEQASSGPALILDIEAEATTPVLNRSAERLVATASSLEGCASALSLLRSMRRTDHSELSWAPVPSPEAAIARVRDEIVTTWPSFERVGLDPVEFASRFDRLAAADDLVGALQRQVALLGDGHTTVHARPGRAPLPYTAQAVDGGIVFADVPAGTAAARAGVSPGDQLVAEVDAADRAGAPAHLLPWLIGRRALSGPIDTDCEFLVRRPDGSTVVFTDRPGAATWPVPIETDRLASGSALLRIRRWLTADIDVVDAALAELGDCARLVVDLRGNAGGSLVAAADFRRRFLPAAARIGSVRFSIGDGGLAEHADYHDEPADGIRWLRPVRFVTDALTYSASEDAILGLGQFDHVEVAGSPSGGGSGRPRTVPIIGDAVLTVSTALTYDHLGRCVEGSGIHIDRPTPAGLDPMSHADLDW